MPDSTSSTFFLIVCRRDAVQGVVSHLLFAAAVGLAPSRVPSTPVIRSAYMITRPSELRAARPMVWISEVSDRRKPSLSASRMATSPHSGMSRPSRRQVDADQHIKRPQPQIPQDFNAFDGVDVGMHIAHADALFVQIFGQILGHPLGQGGDQHAQAARGDAADFVQQVVDLHLDRADFDHRVDQAGGADHLFGEDAAGLLHLPRRGGGARRTPIAGASRPIPRTSAGGCPCRRAGGTRVRPASSCGGSRPCTCRRSAAPKRGIHLQKQWHCRG